MKGLYIVRVAFTVLILCSLQSLILQAHAQCMNDVTLSSQAQVDAFPVNFGCAEITGTLTISGADITAVDSLYELTSVGRLMVTSNPSLLNLDGLAHVSRVGGAAGETPFDVFINANAALADITGLRSLKTVGQGLQIGGCPNLANLNGLENLNSIGGLLAIVGNNSLANIDALAGLDSVGTMPGGAAVNIMNNPALLNLNGLISLKSLPGRIQVINNGALENLKGLDSLAHSKGSVYVVNNASLKSLKGLESLTDINGTAETVVLISGNPMLSTLSGLSLTSIAGPVATTGIIISGNASLRSLHGLSTLTNLTGFVTIDANPRIRNLVGLDNLTSLGGQLQITNNDSLRTVNGISLTALGLTGSQSLTIRSNPQLRSLEGLSDISSIPGGVIISSNASLKTLAGFESVTTLGGTTFTCCPQQLDGTLQITNNASLKNIDGLSNVTTVHHGIFINDNPQLVNVDGLASLAQIKVSGAPGTNPPARLEIKNNTALKNINGLSSLTTMQGDVASVTVTGNTSLVQGCGLYDLLYNNLGCDSQPGCATITISGNGAGCTRGDILDGGSCTGEVAIARVNKKHKKATHSNPANGVVKE